MQAIGSCEWLIATATRPTTTTSIYQRKQRNGSTQTQGKAPTTPKQLLDQLEAYARQQFELRQKMIPTFSIVGPAGRKIVGVASMCERAATTLLYQRLREHFAAERIRLYGFAVEAWMAADIPGEPAFEDLRKREDRKEIVLIGAADLLGTKLSRLLPILRDENGARLGTAKSSGPKTSGILLDLLEEAPAAPRHLSWL